MNSLDRPMRKLLDAASRARKELPESAPFAVEAAVIARRRGAREEDEFALLAMLFRRAVICAAALMMLCGAWSYFKARSNAGTTVLAGYAMQQFPP